MFYTIDQWTFGVLLVHFLDAIYFNLSQCDFERNILSYRGTIAISKACLHQDKLAAFVQIRKISDCVNSRLR